MVLFKEGDTITTEQWNKLFNERVTRKELVTMYKSMLDDIYNKPNLSEWEEIRIKEINYIISYLLLIDVSNDIGGER